jgi:hypothetical protein
MAFWNAALAGGWRSMFWPTVVAALRSECFVLHVVCPACQQPGENDLRAVDIHPNATLSVVVRRLCAYPCSAGPSCWAASVGGCYQFRPVLRSVRNRPTCSFLNRWPHRFCYLLAVDGG